MSQASFQAALGRLVTDRLFREQARAGTAAATAADLTDRERRRLAAIVSDRGLEITATLIRSFRLGKLLTLLPLTRTLLGRRRFVGAAEHFWAGHPPVSFYLVEETLAFCDYLGARLRSGWRVPYLAEVVAYERAMLDLRRLRVDGRPPAPQRLVFRHDPARLLEALAAGQRPRRVPVRPCVFVGCLTTMGEVEWSLDPEDSRRSC